MLNQKLQLKLSQKLSPQQIQLMKLIQLSTLEFEQRLSREIEENPALDTVNESQEIDNDNFELNEDSEKQEKSDDEIFCRKGHWRYDPMWKEADFAIE